MLRSSVMFLSSDYFQQEGAGFFLGEEGGVNGKCDFNHAEKWMRERIDRAEEVTNWLNACFGLLTIHALMSGALVLLLLLH